MGIDLETFVPEYVMIEERGKDKVVSELRKLAKNSPTVWLATDLDREGEAIAWHLKEALHIPDSRAQRVIFNAITKSEIQKAFQSPQTGYGSRERPAGPGASLTASWVTRFRRCSGERSPRA